MSSFVATSLLAFSKSSSESISHRGFVTTDTESEHEFHSGIKLRSNKETGAIELCLPLIPEPLDISKLADILLETNEQDSLEVEIPLAKYKVNLSLEKGRYYAKVDVSPVSNFNFNTSYATFYIGKNYIENLNLSDQGPSVMTVAEHGYAAIVPDVLDDSFVSNFNLSNKKLFVEMIKYSELLAEFLKREPEYRKSSYQLFDHHNIRIDQHGNYAVLFGDGFKFRVETPGGTSSPVREGRFTFSDNDLSDQDKEKKLEGYLNKLRGFYQDCRNLLNNRRLHAEFGLTQSIDLDSFNNGVRLIEVVQDLGNGFKVTKAVSKRQTQSHLAITWDGFKKDLPLSELCEATRRLGAKVRYVTADCPFNISVVPHNMGIARVFFKSDKTGEYPETHLSGQPNRAVLYGQSLTLERTQLNGKKGLCASTGLFTLRKVATDQRPDSTLEVFERRIETLEMLRLHYPELPQDIRKFQIEGLSDVYFFPAYDDMLTVREDNYTIDVRFRDNRVTSFFIRDFDETDNEDRLIQEDLTRFFAVIRDACMRNSLPSILTPADYH